MRTDRGWRAQGPDVDERDDEPLDDDEDGADEIDLDDDEDFDVDDPAVTGDSER